MRSHSTSVGAHYFCYSISSQSSWQSGKTAHVLAVIFMPPEMRAYSDAAAPIWNIPYVANQFTYIHVSFYVSSIMTDWKSNYVQIILPPAMTHR